MFRLIRRVLDFLNLEDELDDFEKIHKSIEKEIMFKGTNLWILIFAILVASVGLNMNSTAVIIGAMLISPLMGPINGMGYSIATYDSELFRKSLRHFTFAVVASLATSTLYFAISPISTAHSELLARTSPTIYDVLIALFGGLAGIIAISSKFKGNVIPGVAIATALMPPLCTAGYGLATGQFDYFFGAFYLFTINTVFIALSSVIISQILKFPIRTIVGAAQRKKVNRAITAVIILILFPSIYFGWLLVQKERFTENAARFVQSVSKVEGNYLLRNDVNPSSRTITLVYGGTTMNEERQSKIREDASNFSLNNAEIIFQQGMSTDAPDLRKTEAEKMRAEMNRLNMVIQQKQELIDSIGNSRMTGRQILEEIQALYPQILACSYGETSRFADGSKTPANMIVIIFTLKNRNLDQADREKIKSWLKTKLKTESLRIYYEN